MAKHRSSTVSSDLWRDEPESGNTPVRTAPKLELVAEGEVNIHISEEDELRRLYSTKTDEAAILLLKSAVNAFGQSLSEYIDLMTAMAVEMEPRDAIESMLITQMTATHVALTETSRRLHHADSPQMREVFERSFTRLSRTFLSQMDQLKKYRAKAQQVVRVERVTVSEGGQAIIGDVTHWRGAHDKN